ncbi:MAG: hypothetical protein ACR2M0_00260 [Chloroflexia bacterium]
MRRIPKIVRIELCGHPAVSDMCRCARPAICDQQQLSTDDGSRPGGDGSAYSAERSADRVSRLHGRHRPAPCRRSDQAAAPTNVLPGAAGSGSAPSTSAAAPPAPAAEPTSPNPAPEKAPGLVPRASPTAGPAFNDAAPRTQQGSPTTGFPLWPVGVGLGLLALVRLGASFFVRPGKGA